MKKIRLDNHSETVEVLVDDKVWEQYLTDYVEAYAKKSHWYSVGKMSGRILYEGRMYGEIEEFVKNLPSASVLEADITGRNPDLLSPEKIAFNGEYPTCSTSAVTYTMWLSLDDVVYDECKEQVEMAIKKEIGGVFKKDLDYQFQAYGEKGDKVVYFSFYQTCDGYGDIYKVPLDVAYELYLGDYQGREMSRFDDLWDRLAPYEVSVDVEYDKQGWIEKSPFYMIEAFNFD